MSSDTLRSEIKSIGTTANASLTSQRSTSPTDQPAAASASFAAWMGAVVNQTGSCACAPNETNRANGGAPIASAVTRLVTTSAAAPSLNGEALAAVIVPSASNAG